MLTKEQIDQAFDSCGPECEGGMLMDAAKQQAFLAIHFHRQWQALRNEINRIRREYPGLSEEASNMSFEQLQDWIDDAIGPPQ